MSKMTIKVHEAKEVPAALKDIVANALDYEMGKGRCVTFTKDPTDKNRFVTTLYDLDGNVLDQENTTVYHAACYFRGTGEDIFRNEGVDGLTFYRG